jgi:dUTP pyrophosphatase
MVVKVINKSAHPLPDYATLFSAGMDLRANLKETVLLRPLQRILIPTGIIVEIPQGYEDKSVHEAD